MLIEKGCVVRSIFGRDAERFYIVLKVQDGFAFISDGKVRPLEKPKRKNVKHLRPTKTFIDVDSLTTNNQFRQALRSFNAPQVV